MPRLLAIALACLVALGLIAGPAMANADGHDAVAMLCDGDVIDDVDVQVPVTVTLLSPVAVVVSTHVWPEQPLADQISSGSVFRPPRA